MMNRKALLSLVISLAIATTTAGSVAAQEPHPTPTVAASALSSPDGAPVSTAITYQGQLKQNGSPANGNYDFQFILYDAASGGNQQGSTVQLNNITANNGIFTAQLDFGQAVFNGEARFLEVRVKPAGSTESYIVLSPRTTLGVVPYALGVPGVMVKNGNVGVGTANPSQKFHVAGSFLRVDGRDNEAAYLGGEFGDNVQVGSFNSAIRNVDMWNMATGDHMNLVAQDITALGNTKVNGSVSFDGNLYMGGIDFVMLPNGRGDGGRAMVHWENDTLVLNFGQDFSGGTVIDGPLSVGGGVQLSAQKLCSVISAGYWRDSIMVSSSWSPDTCRRFRDAVGATQYQLACVFADDFSFGDVNGGAPSANCGW
ncbi:MAG: hypothetical protein R3C14_23740 [Caldilineaceae bacterium]